MSKLLLVFAFIFALAMTQNVQCRYYAQGTFETDKIDKISTLVNNMSDVLLDSSHSDTISTALNTAYDTFWNVIIVVQKDHFNPKDAVMFGYAFNNRWIWFNGLSNINNQSILIWKDYNCGATWSKVPSFYITALSGTTQGS
jgi:hypothetical protein